MIVGPQCLIETGEGLWFLCPRYLRQEAETYFETAYNDLQSDRVPAPLPDYLVEIEGPHRLYFYNARTDDKG
jgi:hypothetical protein